MQNLAYIRLTFGCKADQNDPISLQLNVFCNFPNTYTHIFIYTKFSINIRNHVEKCLEI